MDAEEERQRLSDQLNAELNKRELSNAENFDKAILTYSSAGLAFSLAFLKDFLPITKASWGWLLYCSWILFTLSIIVTIISYITSQLGIKKERDKGERYYRDKIEEALKEKNIFVPLTERLNYGSGIIFVLAVVFTTLFVSINLERATTMTEQKKVAFREGAPIPIVQKLQRINDGAPVPTIQKVAQPGDLRKGAPVPTVQPVTQQPQPQQPQQQGSSQGSSSTGGNKSNP